jgi:hypothetical protein
MSGEQPGNLPIEKPELQRLFVDWLIQLLDERYGVKARGSSGAQWNVTLSDDSRIEVEFDHSGQPMVQGPIKYEDDLTSVAEDAHRRTLELDFGTGAWWKASFSTDMGDAGMWGITTLHFMRIMSEHNSRRFQGDWRLGGEALVSFQQVEQAPAPVVIPKFDVQVTFRVPAPGPGPHAEFIAEELGTFLRATASFATAAPLLGLTSLFPAEEEEVTDATAKLPGAPELPVEGEPLWPQILSLVQGLDSPEAIRRVQGAMYAYEQAMRQESEYVTIALLVSALEALSVPNANWKLERVTTRFFRFVQELCPHALSEVMRHANFTQAFGTYTSERRFLDSLYSLRSQPLHTGFLQHRLSAVPMRGGTAGIRIALISELVRAGIVEFLRRPFSSLIGHPEIAPPARTLGMGLEETNTGDPP